MNIPKDVSIKFLIAGTAVAIGLGFGGGYVVSLLNSRQSTVETLEPKLPQNNSGSVTNTKEENAVCIQVLTQAENPNTGEVKIFPNPCAVPEGWHILEPENNKILQ